MDAKTDKVSGYYLYDEQIGSIKVSETEQVNETKIGSIHPKDKLRAAKQILLALSILFFCGIVAAFFNFQHSETILDCCKTVLPPLATLIIAFYFKDKA